MPAAIEPIRSDYYVKRRGKPVKLRRSGWCPCGMWRQSLHRDHIVPLFKGGTDEPENIQYICANCHEDKSREDLKGRIFSPETIEKMRLAQLGKRYSAETRAKVAAAGMGRRHTDEAKAKIGAAHRGKFVSKATRAKASASLKLAFQRKREGANCLQR